ncbi:hypothetical protein [Agarivorans sp. DSG3-1]|uniref:hypothetical protein n=1 Tax=Agarivorans sp. DSG3-1 TaxID=3342249 RepID=UPI00398E9E65
MSLEQQMLHLVTNDQARYQLKLYKLPEKLYDDIRHSIQPLTGTRQSRPAPVFALKNEDRQQLVLSGVGVVAGLLVLAGMIRNYLELNGLFGSEGIRLDSQLASVLHGLLVASLLIGNGLSQLYGKTIYQRIKRARANTVALIAFILFLIAVGLNEGGVLRQFENSILANVIAISLTLTFVGLLVFAYFLKKRAEK